MGEWVEEVKERFLPTSTHLSISLLQIRHTFLEPELTRGLDHLTLGDAHYIVI